MAGMEEYRVRVHYDGWDDIYDDWFDVDSIDLHPVGWCNKTGHPLEPPLSKLSFANDRVRTSVRYLTCLLSSIKEGKRLRISHRDYL